MKITIQLKTRDIELTSEEARQMFEELSAHFRPVFRDVFPGCSVPVYIQPHVFPAPGVLPQQQPKPYLGDVICGAIGAR